MPDANRPPTFDHQKKKPLEKRVRVYLDDEPIAELDVARAELAAAEEREQTEYLRRLEMARKAPSIPSAAELLTIDDGLVAAREERLAPFRAAVETAEAAVLVASQEFVFRSPRIERDGKQLRGHRAFQELIAEHPPQDDDHDETRTMTGRAEALARWHSDTFIPALVSACASEPEIPLEQAVEMCAEWTDAEVGDLFAASLLVSQGARQVELGKASRAATKRS